VDEDRDEVLALIAERDSRVGEESR